MNNFFGDKELEKRFGRRPEGAIAVFDAMELGWVCPIDAHHEITWSEFNEHVWCYQCEKDFFTLLCPKQMNPFTSAHILKKETERIAPEMAKWTLAKYK